MPGSRDALVALVRAELAASGKTQTEVAAAAGITDKHLSRFVGGHDGMSLDVVDRVLAACGRELVLATRIRPVRPRRGRAA